MAALDARTYATFSNFDGNLNQEGKAVVLAEPSTAWSVETGTAAYTATSNGQGLQTDSGTFKLANISAGTALTGTDALSTCYRVGLVVETGATDGVIFMVHQSGPTGKPVCALTLETAFTRVRWTEWDEDGLSSSTYTQAYTADTFFEIYGERYGATHSYGKDGVVTSSVTNKLQLGIGNDYWSPAGKTYDLWIGKGVDGTTPTNNPLSSDTGAGGVILDFLYDSIDNEGFDGNGGGHATGANTVIDNDTSNLGGVQHFPSVVVAKSTGGGGPVAPTSKESWS